MDRSLAASPWLGFFEDEGLAINAPLRIELPDLDDVPFLEVAPAAQATLITGITRCCPSSEVRRVVAVLHPASFLGERT